jgi:hypothetical protein
VRALVGFVAGLLAVVAKALRRGAHLSVVANVAALITGTTREGRHDGRYVFLVISGVLRGGKSAGLSQKPDSKARALRRGCGGRGKAAAATRRRMVQ